MKRLIAAILVLCMCVGFYGCSNALEEQVSTTQPTEEQETLPPSEIDPTKEPTQNTEKVFSKEELLNTAEETTIEQISTDTFNSVVKAKQLYCGKVLKLSGVVYEIEEGHIILRAEQHVALGKAGITVSLSNEDLMLLNKGQKIMVVGQTAEDTETHIDAVNNNYESHLFVMTQAYIIQDTFRISGEVWSANDDFMPAYNFSVEDLWYSPLVYFAEGVDTSVFPDADRTITVEGKFIYDGKNLSDVVDAIIVE